MVGNVRGNIWERNCTGIVKNRRSDDEGELYRNRLTNQCNDLWEKSMVQCIALELGKKRQGDDGGAALELWKIDDDGPKDYLWTTNLCRECSLWQSFDKS